MLSKRPPWYPTGMACMNGVRLYFLIYTMRPEQNSYFVDDIFKCVFLKENVEFWFIFHLSLFWGPSCQICLHWLRLYRHWPRYMPLYGIPGPQWVKSNEVLTKKSALTTVDRSSKWKPLEPYFTKEACPRLTKPSDDGSLAKLPWY